MVSSRGGGRSAGGPRLALAAACLALAACGSPSVAPTTDGGPVQVADQLVAQSRTEVGLAFGNAEILRVLYMDADGSPRPGRRVEFSITGDARGSTLSATGSLTDGAGVASVEVRAGQSETTFEVRAANADAGSVAFVVSVNELGEFATLLVRASIPSDLEVSGALTVLLYDQELDGVTCASLPAYAPPTASRTKTAPAPDKDVTFGPLLTGRAFTVLMVPAVEGVPDVAGCVDVLPDRLLVGVTLLTLVPLHELLAAPAAGYELTSTFLVGALDEVAGAFAPLACPQAPADVILDCLVDARTTSDDDPLDCVPSSADKVEDVGLALNAHRGFLASSGCRDANIVPGVPSPSLEKALRDYLVAALPAATAALGTATRPEQVSQALASMTIRSTLRLEPTLARDRWVAVHALRRATFTDAPGTGTYDVDLTAQGLPLARAADIPVTLSAAGELTISGHELSLRFGRLARRAAGALLFEPHGLPGDSAALVGLFTAALADGHASACAALEALLCPAAGLAAGCLGTSCDEALAALPASLDAGLAAFDGGADLQLLGSARPTGAAGPVAEYLTGGQWSAGLGPAAARTPLTATFAGMPEPATRHLIQSERDSSIP